MFDANHLDTGPMIKRDIVWRRGQLLSIIGAPAICIRAGGGVHAAILFAKESRVVKPVVRALLNRRVQLKTYTVGPVIGPESPDDKKTGMSVLRVYRFLMEKIEKVRMSNGAADERVDKRKR